MRLTQAVNNTHRSFDDLDEITLLHSNKNLFSSSLAESQSERWNI